MGKIKLILTLALVVFTCQLAAAENARAENPGEETARAEENWDGKAVILPVKGPILDGKFGGRADALIAAIGKAGKAKRLILEIDSPGGAVSACDRICAALLQCPAPTTALVLRQAVSGGAMVATACREIYMLPGARIGDIQPMSLLGGQMDERTAEKIEADVRAIMAANANRNGYPKPLLEAMVSRSFEIYEVKFTDGAREFLTAPEFTLLKENQDAGRDQRQFAAPPRIVSHKGKLLAVDTADAVSLGLAKAETASREALLAQLGVKADEVMEGVISEGELKILPLSRGLTLLLVVFLLVGVAGTLTEMHTPGFGLPGAFGLIGFSCFFYILISHDRAEWYELALFIAGIILMVLEIVVLPGFGVCGIIGGLCLMAGLGLALLPDLGSEYLSAHFSEEVTFAGLITLGTVVGGAALFIALLSRGGKLPLGRQAFLEDSLPDYPTAVRTAPETDTARAAIPPTGARGTAATDLRPAGKVSLEDGKEIDAVSTGEFIEKGTPVTVSAVSEGHAVVRRTDLRGA